MLFLSAFFTLLRFLPTIIFFLFIGCSAFNARFARFSFFFFYSIPFCTVLLFLFFSCSSFVLNIGGVVHTILGSFMVGRPIIAAVSQDAVAYWPAAQRRELTVCLFSTHYLDPLLFIFPSLSLPVCLFLSFLVALRMFLCVCICR